MWFVLSYSGQWPLVTLQHCKSALGGLGRSVWALWCVYFAIWFSHSHVMQWSHCNIARVHLGDQISSITVCELYNMVQSCHTDAVGTMSHCNAVDTLQECTWGIRDRFDHCENDAAFDGAVFNSALYIYCILLQCALRNTLRCIEHWMPVQWWWSAHNARLWRSWGFNVASVVVVVAIWPVSFPRS